MNKTRLSNAVVTKNTRNKNNKKDKSVPSKPLSQDATMDKAMQLLMACQSRDSRKIGTLIRKGAPLSASTAYRLPSGETVLQTPITSALLGEFMEISQGSASPDMARKKTLRILDILLREGVDPNVGAEYTVEIIEKIGGMKDILPQLLGRGMTAFHMSDHRNTLNALLHANVQALRILAKEGTNLNERDQEGDNAFQSAVRLKAPLPFSPLALAGEPRAKQWSEYLRELKSVGIDIENRNSKGWTPLQDALNTNQTDLALGLVYAGAQLNRDSDDPYAPVCIAAIRCDLNTVRRLIAVGADYSPLTSLPRKAVDTQTWLFAQSLLTPQPISCQGMSVN